MTSLVPLPSLRRRLEEVTDDFHEALLGPEGEPALTYWTNRGLSKASALSFRIGVVTDPPKPLERYTGRLSIPYITRAGVTTIRFRAIDGGEPKYLGMRDIPSARIFNPAALSRREDFVCITEGELDAVAASQAGLPAVGIPGVSNWRPFFRHCFQGYRRVYILQDTDKPRVLKDCGDCDGECRGHTPPGQKFAEAVAAQVERSKVITIPGPPGSDVNSFLQEHGEAELRKLVTG